MNDQVPGQRRSSALFRLGQEGIDLMRREGIDDLNYLDEVEHLQPYSYWSALLAWFVPRYRWHLFCRIQAMPYYQSRNVQLHVRPWPLPEKVIP